MKKYEIKSKGAFFTSQDISSYLINRILKDTNTIILEPSFGDGSFINSIINLYRAKKATKKLKVNFWGIEIQKVLVDRLKKNPLFDKSKILLSDFINVKPFPVDIIIGNPPYVGLNKLHEEERKRSQDILALYDFKMQSSGSLWFPFILHSCAFLKKDGIIAFVLPFEFTYVRYAKQLWRLLSSKFNELTVIRVYEDIFPNVDVETILFIAKGYGGSTNYINYEIYSDRNSLFKNKKIKKYQIAVDSTQNGDRPFISNLLESSTLNFVKNLKNNGIVDLISRTCKFKIGYVSGDINYFHPEHEIVNKYKLPATVLMPAIANAKVIKGSGLYIDKGEVNTKLFYPSENKINNNIYQYIDYGEHIGINKKFKCLQRNPWYITPGIEQPDLILTVFGDKPKLYINNGDYYASNSLLCGFIKDSRVSANKIAACWYNSLTLLSIELKVHSLGGGVLVFIPGETDSIETINPSIINDIADEFYLELNNLLKNGKIEEAYQLGDHHILKGLGLSNKDIESIRTSVNVLRNWRNARLRKNHNGLNKFLSL